MGATLMRITKLLPSPAMTAAAPRLRELASEGVFQLQRPNYHTIISGHSAAAAAADTQLTARSIAPTDYTRVLLCEYEVGIREATRRPRNGHEPGVRTAC